MSAVGSAQSLKGSIEPHEVVRMGNLKRFIWPLRYFAVHMMESVPRIGTSCPPSGTTSA